MELFQAILKKAFEFTSYDPNTSLFNEPLAVINILDGREGNINDKILALNAPLQHH